MARKHDHRAWNRDLLGAVNIVCCSWPGPSNCTRGSGNAEWLPFYPCRGLRSLGVLVMPYRSRFPPRHCHPTARKDRVGGLLCFEKGAIHAVYDQ